MDCPECGEIESIRYTPQHRYTIYRCDECGHEWEEDLEGSMEWHHKSIGFANLYTSQVKVRALYEKHHGPIPGHWQLHHIDHNPHNQDIGNLIAIPKDIHDLIHANPRAYGSRTSIEALLTTKT
jgi:Zn ribbon nucleic-acid-binding protein